MKVGMKELAARINSHLKRIENDPALNPYDKPGGCKSYYCAGAYYPGGAKVFVCYITYQGRSHLTRAEAAAYLAWLDAGNVGRHYEQQREEGTRK